MKKRIIDFMVFIFCVVSLIISLKMFWNMGVYVDEHNTSPDVVVGGPFWLMMDWLRLFLLFFASLFSGLRLFEKKGE